MTAQTEKQPSETERLVSLLKQAVSSDEPTESELAELGESLLVTVKGALSGNTN
jgi:hypothetical protein